MKWFSRILCSYFFLLPFQFALAPSDSIDLPVVRILTPLLFLLWVMQGLLRKRIILPPLLPLFFLFGFLLLASASFTWAENPVFAFRKATFLLSFFLLFIVLASWFEEYPEARISVLKSFILGSFFSAVSGIAFFGAQFVFGVERTFAFLTHDVLPFFLGNAFAQSVAEHPSLLVNISGTTVLRASGVFPDPHMFAFSLGMASPIAFALFLLTSSPSKKRLSLVLFSTIFLADLLSFSRGGYVGLLFGGVFFAFASGIMSRFSFKQRLGACALVLVVGATIMFSPFGTRFLSSFSHADGSNVERLRLWQEAVGHMAERPLFGVGLGNYPLLVKPSASWRDPIYAHNLFLDIAVEIGILGAICFIGLLLIPAKRAYAFFRSHKDAWLPLSIAAAIMVFFGHSLFETPLFSVHVLPALILLLASGVSYRYETTRPV